MQMSETEMLKTSGVESQSGAYGFLGSTVGHIFLFFLAGPVTLLQLLIGHKLSPVA